MQIGAGVGAALTILMLVVLQDLWPKGDRSNLSNLLIGILGGFGALLGMAVVSLVDLVRRRRRQEDFRDPIPEGKEDMPAQSAAAPSGRAERNGSPGLRVAAGLLALLFAGALVMMLAQAKFSAAGGVPIAVLAIAFGWYAVCGNKGLSRFHTKE
jgi:hypothetical protein